MAFSIQVISTKTIKPNSPTPQNLSHHKLCLLDQLIPPVYGCFILFYPPDPEHSIDQVHECLMSSLSSALTHFYPLAGRIQDGLSINCSDNGVCYVAALASVELSEFVNDQIQAPGQLVTLLPIQKRSPDIADQVLMGVQVTSFACGGIAIGISVWHQVSDASTRVSFLKTWAAICRGEVGHDHVRMDGIVTHCSSAFPPREPERVPEFQKPTEELVTNKFSFDASKIASLREKIGNGKAVDRPTRYEALTALIWGATISMNQDKFPIPSGKFSYKISMVEMRNKANPPLPQHCMGNIVYPAIEKWEMDKAVDHQELAAKVRRSIRMVNEEYVISRSSENPYTQMHVDHVKDGGAGPCGFTSYCRLPFYEIDFGFGKPSLMAPYASVKGVTMFVDAKDGEGIEAWVTFSKQDMAKFEQDPGIIKYAKFSNSC